MPKALKAAGPLHAQRPAERASGFEFQIERRVLLPLSPEYRVDVRVFGTMNYGRLKLLPYWDPLRGDPRFEKIVDSLAPRAANK